MRVVLMSFLHFDFCMLHYRSDHMATAEKSKAGLEDIVATSSAICYLDGDRGVLAYCGYDIHDLAQSATFEEVCFLLWHRRLPTRAELGDLQSQLAASRQLKEPIIRLMRSLPPVDGMDALRTVTSALAHYESRRRRTSPAAQYRKAVRLTAQLGSIVATLGTTTGRWWTDCARSGDGPRGELPLHAHR
jgi:citrate synthase